MKQTNEVVCETHAFAELCISTKNVTLLYDITYRLETLKPSIVEIGTQRKFVSAVVKAQLCVCLALIRFAVPCGLLRLLFMNE